MQEEVKNFRSPLIWNSGLMWSTPPAPPNRVTNNDKYPVESGVSVDVHLPLLRRFGTYCFGKYLAYPIIEIGITVALQLPSKTGFLFNFSCGGENQNNRCKELMQV